LAKQFYEGTLGLRLVDDSEFALVFDANGVEVRIQKLKDVSPPSGTVLGWRVDRLHEVMTDLTRRGVAFERFPFLEQDAQGVWTSPDGTCVVWFKDPDGNTLSLTETPAA
jgi:catechol 2,3-dioxygenase-like lactoylglutathione lyase family enzyme